jgi:hypothetical protein
MDFTLNSYISIIRTLLENGYFFMSFKEYIKNPAEKGIVLRHDVDRLPENALKMAKIENYCRVVGSYYFRVLPGIFDEKIISQIANLGHEIGYHYETMDTSQGDPIKAWDEFRHNLDTFRRIVPVSTICMHGSPRSKYDNKDLWKSFDYHSVGIIGEPYFDIDFNKVAYLSDTGRRWNGASVSVRDKVQSNFTFNFKSTFDIINNISLLPDQVMFTFHPQRWTDNPILWVKELAMQNAKNAAKYFIVKIRKE